MRHPLPTLGRNHSRLADGEQSPQPEDTAVGKEVAGTALGKKVDIEVGGDRELEPANQRQDDPRRA